MSIEIRNARDEEYAAVGELLQDSYRQYMPANAHRAGWREYFDTEIPNVEGRLPDGLPLVAVEDDQIVGTVTYYGPGLGTSEGWKDGIAAIRLLGVPPASRGLGLGRILTQECIDRARADGARSVGLHNHESMAVARAMYLRMGFVRIPDHDFVVDEDTLVEAFILEL